MGEKIDRLSEDHMEIRKETYARYTIQIKEFEREGDKLPYQSRNCRT